MEVNSAAKYITALHSLFNTIEKARKVQYLTQRRAAKKQYVRTYIGSLNVPVKYITALNIFHVYCSN